LVNTVIWCGDAGPKKLYYINLVVSRTIRYDPHHLCGKGAGGKMSLCLPWLILRTDLLSKSVVSCKTNSLKRLLKRISMLFLGIDVGSSSVKLSVLDGQSGKSLGSVTHPETELAIQSPRAGWAEQD